MARYRGRVAMSGLCRMMINRGGGPAGRQAGMPPSKEADTTRATVSRTWKALLRCDKREYGQCPGDFPERHHHHLEVVQGGSLSEPAPRQDSILNSPLENCHDTTEGRKVRAAHRRTSDSLGCLSANRIPPLPMVIQLPP